MDWRGPSDHFSRQQYFAVFILLLSQVLVLVDSYCPPQCICVTNRMNCEQPGLRQLPRPYMPQLEYLLVQNQTLDSTHLGPRELAVYKSTEYDGEVQLRVVYIRYCNLLTIGRYAFQQLGSKLEMIDLTGNPLQQIGDYAFHGLPLLTLILDHVQRPHFSDHTFGGLARMKSLMMRHSGLTALPFKALRELTDNQRLGKLLLKGNQLTRLDPKFDHIFSQLQDFEISENPWHCDCSLNWLIRRFRIMSERRKANYRRRQDSLLNNEWGQEDNEPQCASPQALVRRNFTDLVTHIDEIFDGSVWKSAHQSPSILHCPPPQLVMLEVGMGSYALQSKSTLHTNDHSITAQPFDSIELKCGMRGSPSLSVVWQYHDPTSGHQSVTESQMDKESTQRLGSDLDHPADNRGMVQVEERVWISKRNEWDIYSCIGMDVVGNVSADVRIHWPVSDTNLHVDDDKLSKTASTSIIGTDGIDLHRLTAGELESQSFLYAKHYNLFQLISTIIGTFLSTVLIFFSVYFLRRHVLLYCAQTDLKRRDCGNKVARSHIGSPGGTSSSNASSSAAVAVLTGQTTAPSYEISAHTLGHQRPLMNPYNLLLNNTIPCQPTAYPLGLQQLTMTQPMSRVANLHTSQNTSIAASTYEPVAAYHEPNIVYDVPWKDAQSLGDCNGQMTRDQSLPLLSADPKIMSSVMNNNSGILQSAIMIPPPPPIPQPALPLPVPPVTPTNASKNLMLLQTGASSKNAYMGPTASSSDR